MAPEIHTLLVSVGCAEQLALSLPHWMMGSASVTVVSTHADRETERVCRTCILIWERTFHRSYDLRLHLTNAFTMDGADFNKGRAMEEARQQMPWREWILFCDADIVPQYSWWHGIEDLEPGYLYGAQRRQVSGLNDIGSLDAPVMDDDRIGYGYFQLFRALDPKVQRTPLLDTHWRHAGNYDSNFLLSFGSYVRELPINLWHLGNRHENWYGIGQKSQFDQMMQTRNGQGIHPSEKIGDSQ